MKLWRKGAVVAMVLMVLILGGVILGYARSGNHGQGLTIEQVRAIAEARGSSDETPMLQVGAFVVTRADVQQRIAAICVSAFAPGNSSPAICSSVNWSNGLSLLNARIT